MKNQLARKADMEATFNLVELLAAEAEVNAVCMNFLKPATAMTVSEWADHHRMLSGKASSEPGRWKTSRTPYLKQIMDDLSAQSRVQEVVMMFAAQLGKSETGNNWIGYIIANEPGPVMLVQPTTDTARRYSKQRIAPMLEDTPALKQKIQDNKSRDDSNTVLVKDFAGGVLVISGANSAAGLRSMPVRYLMLDEIDAYPQDVDGEGSPVELAEKRTSTFSRRKILKISTPTMKDFSRIEAAFLETDARVYEVPCPHCGGFQSLVWGTDKAYGVRWDKDEAGHIINGSEHYVCRHHGCIIQEHHKAAMLAAGQWVATRPGRDPGKRTGYHLNALYAPLGWISWLKIIQDFQDASNAATKGDVTLLKTWVNAVLAETWEEDGDKIATHELAKRAEDYALTTVPSGGLIVVAGVDTQGDRLEAYAYAIGRSDEWWLVDHRVFYGDPSLPEREEGSPWQQLTTWRQQPLHHASGALLHIAACAVDSGGHHTQQVYTYTRQHQAQHVLAVKGSSQSKNPVLGKPSDVEVNYRGQKLKNGAKLWPVGTDTAKAAIYSRLHLAQAGPGYIHFSRQTPAYVYEQLTSERLVTKYFKGRPKLEWIKPAGRRNEALDCTVYALAASFYLGVHKYVDHHWKAIEIGIRQQELLLADQPAKADATTAVTTAAPAVPTRPAADQLPKVQKQINRRPAARPGNSWMKRW